MKRKFLLVGRCRDKCTIRTTRGWLKDCRQRLVQEHQVHRLLPLTCCCLAETRAGAIPQISYRATRGLHEDCSSSPDGTRDVSIADESSRPPYRRWMCPRKACRQSSL